jgi:hypothetical protein
MIGNAGVAQIYEETNSKLNDEILRNSLSNTQLQRIIYKYESTFAQLDIILRKEDDKDQCIFELKKITEK